MAWVTEYDLTWRSQTDSGDIYIQRDGGSYQFPLTLKRNSLKIKSALPSWEDQIIRTNCSFTIVNDLSNFYELMPLMTISEGQYRVIVMLDTQKIFEGYLNCEAVNQNMLNKSDIRLTASGLLDKLKWVDPDSIDTLKHMSLIDIIDDCLLLTGSSYDIWVNCSLYESSSPLTSSHTLFNKTAIFTETFWVDNVERKSALDIISMILKPFNCYLFWYNEKWYIEHYEDLWLGSKPYVEYTTGGSYSPIAGGTLQTTGYGQNAIHSPTLRPQARTSQMLSVNPGLRQLDIQSDFLDFFNLFNGDLTNTIENNSTFVATMPEWRQWYAFTDWYQAAAPPSWQWHDVWSWPGTRSGGITNAIRRGTSVSSGFQPGIFNGMTTRFRITAIYDTELTIKFKWKVITGQGAYPQHIFSRPEDMEITFRWFLKHNVSDFWIVYNETADTWDTSPSITENTFTIIATELDPDRWIYEAEINIPIGDILGGSSGVDEDLDLVFNLRKETITDIETDVEDRTALDCTLGDFHASISESVKNNLVKGVITTDFLDKKTISLQLVDGGWSHRNSLVTGVGYTVKTAMWGWDSNYDTLANKLMESKFRLYRIARQKMTIEYSTGAKVYIPLSRWYDSKQSNKTFILAADTYKVEEDIHAVELWEYDDTETITLI